MTLSEFQLWSREVLEEKVSSTPSQEPTHFSSDNLFPWNERRTASYTLPIPLTQLIGREQEVMTLCTMLRQPEVRLLTLTGMGGIGKTRLGLQIATELSDEFIDGVYFAPLASINDPSLVVPTIAQVLGLKESGDYLLAEHVKSYLRERHVLLLIDNFEHVMLAAPRITELLTSCPHLKILVTSRAVLYLNGEHEFLVSPLALPDLKQLPIYDALLQYAAIKLFMQSVQAVKANFQLTSTNARSVAEICVKLEGLPLALELAAARIKLLSPQALLSRLESQLHILTGGSSDVLERQQTLRNTIRWSYNLLSPAEQLLFRQLSVFVGSFTVEAAEYVCAASSNGAFSVLDGLTSLLDKSLLQQIDQGGDDPRLFMLQVVREYGLTCLTANEEETTRYTHSSYYIAVAERVSPNLASQEQRKWFDLLEREHNNLRAALQWLLEKKETEMALQLSGELGWFWFMRGYQVEGRKWLDRTLAEGGSVAAPIQASALHGASRIALYQDNFYQATILAEKTLTLFREIGDRRGIALAIRRIGEVAERKHNYVTAYALLEESLQMLREELTNNSPHHIEVIKTSIAFGLGDLAAMISYRGDFDTAHSLAEEGIALFREMNNKTGIMFGLSHLAKVKIAKGDFAKAHTLQEKVLSIAKEMEFKWDFASSLHLLGQLALYQSNEAEGHVLLKESLELYTFLGNQWSRAKVLVLLTSIAASQGDDAVAHSLYEESLATLRKLDDKESIAALLEDVAEAVIQMSPAWAVRLWGCAEALREVIGIPFSPFDYFPYKRSLTVARASLGERAFVSTWAEGRTMTHEQAIAVYTPTSRRISPSPTKSPIPYPNELSNREVEVLRLLAKGLTNVQIADKLVISPRTVDSHLTSIYRKIEVSTRSAATHYALKHHLA